MNNDWLNSANDKLSQGWNQLNSVFYTLAEPRRTAQVRRLVYALAAIWLLLTLARVFWLMLPEPEGAESAINIANPLGLAGTAGAPCSVNIDALASWELFGSASQVATSQTAASIAAVPTFTDNIEDNARETRLALKLVGVVASSDPEVAVAMIEHKGKQKAYHLEEKLPVSGKVTVAKIMPDRVVLDNSGKYELLKLFDRDSIASSKTLAAPAPAKTKTVDNRSNANVTEMAEQYRQRLYRDPQSLAEVVKISAVRKDGQLQGYRVSPGKDRAQFEQIGFQPGDVVTGVNGIVLTDPGKAMELYRVMRSAQEASFDIQRGDESLNISVSFDAADAQ